MSTRSTRSRAAKGEANAASSNEAAPTGRGKRQREEEAATPTKDNTTETSAEDSLPIAINQPKRPKQAQHAIWFFEQLKVYSRDDIKNILTQNGCTDFGTLMGGDLLTCKSVEGEAFNVLMLTLGTHKHNSHVCSPSNFVWSTDYGEPVPEKNPEGSYSHLFVTGDDVELEGVENPENDTNHFLYLGLLKFRSAMGSGLLASYSRIDYTFLRPQALSSDALDKIGSHFLKCKRNKYGSMMCFIDSKTEFQRFGARIRARAAPAPAVGAAPAGIQDALSLGSLPLKEDQSPLAAATSAPSPAVAPARAAAPLDAAQLPELNIPYETFTLEKISEDHGVFTERDSLDPNQQRLVINALAVDDVGTGIPSLMARIATVQQPFGLYIITNPTKFHLNGYIAALVAKKPTSLVLSNFLAAPNFFTDSCVSDYIAALRAPDCPLRHLHFRGMALSQNGLTSLLSEISTSGKLETLIFERAGFTDDIAQEFVAFKAKVKHLGIIENEIHQKGVEALAPCIASNENLETLDLTSCPLEFEACAPLASALAKSKVRNLNLARTRVGARGVKVILEALCGHKYIHKITLDFIKLGKGGNDAVAKLKKSNPNVEFSLKST